MSEQLRFEDDVVLQEVRTARPGFSDDALSPSALAGQVVLERVLVGRRRPRRMPFRRARGALPVALAAGATLLVVAVAVITLRGHTPAASGGGSKGAGVRGQIVDQDGRVLATSTGSVTHMYIDASRLPRSRSARAAALDRLERALGLRPPAGRQDGANAVMALSGRTISAAGASYLSRHRTRFPEVKLVRTRGRQYPRGRLAAQALGSTANRSGLEGYYDAELSRGDTLATSLNLGLQAAGEQALQRAIDLNPPANGGAFVALDPVNGQVYAMGSAPSYDLNLFGLANPTAVDRRLTNPGSGFPLINRAIQSAGPVGSEFAPITALAALESGAWSIGDRFDDTGEFCLDGQCRHNAGHAVYGVLDVESALKVASNDFFDNLGALTNSPASQGGALQTWARAFGIGRPSGVDLPSESLGTLPTPAWRAQRNQLEAECDAATGPFTGQRKHALGGCGIADGTNRPWSASDNVNLAEGQGDIQVTPLQLAVAYAALANGGTIVRPHLGRALDRGNGTALRRISPRPLRHLKIDPFYLDAVRTGLPDASSQPGGTSADVFGGFPEQVYGETGSAQYRGQQDYAWYAGFVPASATSKPIVVVITVAQGGFGDVAAAPVARQIFSQWFFGRPGAWVAGAAQTL